jgi:hypothetical protein
MEDRDLDAIAFLKGRDVKPRCGALIGRERCRVEGIAKIGCKR